MSVQQKWHVTGIGQVVVLGMLLIIILTIQNRNI